MKANQLQQGDIITVGERQGIITAVPKADETGLIFTSGYTTRGVNAEFTAFNMGLKPDSDVEVFNRDDPGAPAVFGKEFGDEFNTGSQN